jgi:hypothetical protein
MGFIDARIGAAGETTRGERRVSLERESRPPAMTIGYDSKASLAWRVSSESEARR